MSKKRNEAQFSADLGDEVLFIDSETFDSVILSKSEIPEGIRFFTDENKVFLIYGEDGSVSVELPETVVVTVIETEPAPAFSDKVADGVTKPAVTSSGASLFVPFYVSVGDEVEIDLAAGEFLRIAE